MPDEKKPMPPEVLAHFERYLAAAHAMQSGVAMRMQIDPSDTLPKHLRVGINAAMSDGAALVGLLIDKGVITDVDLFKALADQMEKGTRQLRQAAQPALRQDDHAGLSATRIIIRVSGVRALWRVVVKCEHQSPASWKDEAVDARGYTRVVCRHCGRFIGYRPPEKPPTKRSRKKAA